MATAATERKAHRSNSRLSGSPLQSRRWRPWTSRHRVPQALGPRWCRWAADQPASAQRRARNRPSATSFCGCTTVGSPHSLSLARNEPSRSSPQTSLSTHMPPRASQLAPTLPFIACGGVLLRSLLRSLLTPPFSPAARLFPYDPMFRWLSYGNDPDQKNNPLIERDFFLKREWSFTIPGESLPTCMQSGDASASPEPPCPLSYVLTCLSCPNPLAVHVCTCAGCFLPMAITWLWHGRRHLYPLSVFP